MGGILFAAISALLPALIFLQVLRAQALGKRGTYDHWGQRRGHGAMQTCPLEKYLSWFSIQIQSAWSATRVKGSYLQAN
jgi:hypothetical protein